MIEDGVFVAAAFESVRPEVLLAIHYCVYGPKEQGTFEDGPPLLNNMEQRNLVSALVDEAVLVLVILLKSEGNKRQS